VFPPALLTVIKITMEVITMKVFETTTSEIAIIVAEEKAAAKGNRRLGPVPRGWLGIGVGRRRIICTPGQSYHCRKAQYTHS
jgi:hypothetical protein